MAETRTEPIIKLRDCGKTYRTGVIELTALREISLDIHEGEFTVIMGPSGSGKTTLMNIIGCLDRADEGSYFFKGQDVQEMTSNELAFLRNDQIGFVFQSFNLLPRLNLLENVELPMVYHGMGRRERTEKAMAALDAVGIAGWADHKPNEVSGGQKQRAAIARAIIGNPGLLIADEPTGNLDSKSSVEIMNIFSRLNEQGSTILLITHEDGIAAYGKRILRIVDGRIISDEQTEKK